MRKRVERPTIVIEKPSPSKAQFIDFKAEREEWNRYLLEDDTTLRIRFILTGAMVDKTMEEVLKEAERASEKLRIGFTIRSHNVFGVESPPQLRGSPDSRRYSPEELRASIVKAELDFETVRETWNSYVFENGIRLKAKISPTSINRTSKFDSGGIPIYTLDFTIDVLLKLPEEIEKVLRKNQKHRAR
jgi:hypothetical protein